MIPKTTLVDYGNDDIQRTIFASQIIVEMDISNISWIIYNSCQYLAFTVWLLKSSLQIWMILFPFRFAIFFSQIQVWVERIWKTHIQITANFHARIVRESSPRQWKELWGVCERVSISVYFKAVLGIWLMTTGHCFSKPLTCVCVVCNVMKSVSAKSCVNYSVSA